MAPIHEAVRRRDVEALRRELERGVDPDLLVSGCTPLQLLPRNPSACGTEALQCYRLLLENGADVNVRDSINDTMLHDACLYNNPPLVALLLEFGADVGARGSLQNTPLHQSVRLGGFKCAQLLLGAGAEVNARVEINP